MNARTIVHALLLAIAGVLAYGGALLLLSSCDSVQSSLTSPPDSGPPSKPLDAGAKTPDGSPAPDAVPPGSVDAGGPQETSTDARPDSPQRDTGGAREASIDARPDSPELGPHDAGDGGYCVGWTDAGYLAIDGSTGFRFPWIEPLDAGEGGAPCSGFGCWYQCPEGPCPQSSDCPVGLVCIVSRDASLVNPDDYRGTCARLDP
jgi:hypothetical protein